MSVRKNNDANNEHCVTMQEIAKRCDVGLVTVSRALNHQPGVSATNAERIRRIAAEMGYDPFSNSAARKLAKQKYGKKILYRTIGLLFPHDFLQSRFFTLIYRGIIEELAKRGYSLLTMCLNANGESDTDVPLPQFFYHGDVDGLMVFGLDRALQPMFSQLRELVGFGNRPIVALKFQASGCSNVLFDETGGAYLAASHLLELGHRHILLLRYPIPPIKDVTWDIRVDAIRKAMVEHGVDPASCLHQLHVKYDWFDPISLPAYRKQHTGMTHIEASDECFYEYLAAHPEVTALIGQNDICAIRASYLLQRIGKQVPRDMSIVGFDDSDPLPDEYGKNQLTSVAFPLERLGQEAARIVVQRVIGECGDDQRVILPATLSVRGSTSAPCREIADSSL